MYWDRWVKWTTCWGEWGPWWLSGKGATCQCKRHGFDPWVRKILWRRKWQPTPGFLPGKPHGQRSLAGDSPQGHKESDTTACLTCTQAHGGSTVSLSLHQNHSQVFSACLQVPGRQTQDEDYQQEVYWGVLSGSISPGGWVRKQDWGKWERGVGEDWTFSSVQFSSVTQSCLTLCDPMDCSTPGLPVHHQLPEFTQTHVHCVGDAIQPSHPLSSPSPPTFNLSQYQGLFRWVSSSHQVTKVLEFQLQHQSFQWTPRTDLL